MFPFDPWEPFRPRKEGSWLELWSEATQLWTQPAAENAESWGEAGARMLADLVDGLTGRLEGRRIELTLAGRRARATVDWFRMRRTGERFQARAELTEADWDGWPLETLVVSAGSLRVVPPTTLSITDLEMLGRSPLAPVITRLNLELNAWRLSVDDHSRVRAHRRGSAITLTVEPVVRSHQLAVELRSVRVHRLRLDVPAWLRLTRTRTLPPLAHGASIVEAKRCGDMVEFRLAASSISEQFDPARLRDALSRGGLIP